MDFENLTEAEIEALVQEARKPALLLNKTKFPDGPGEPGCWLGGDPTLPPDIEWPYHEVEGVPVPLSFVAQINLARVPRRPEFPPVPETGTLFFFFDPVFSTSDAKVIYVEDEFSRTPPRRMPDPEYAPCEINVDHFLDSIRFRKWNFDFLDFNTWYTGFHREIDQDYFLWSRIGDKQQPEINAAGRATEARWAGSEPGSSQDMSLHYLFGCQSNRPAPSEDSVLLFNFCEDPDVGIVNCIDHLFWISPDAFASRDFDQVVFTKE